MSRFTVLISILEDDSLDQDAINSIFYDIPYPKGDPRNVEDTVMLIGSSSDPIFVEGMKNLTEKTTEGE